MIKHNGIEKRGDKRTPNQGGIAGPHAWIPASELEKPLVERNRAGGGGNTLAVGATRKVKKIGKYLPERVRQRK